MQLSLKVFEYEDHSDFRTIDIDGEPWFVLSDVCRALGLKANNGSYYRHAERLDGDEKQTIPASRVHGFTSRLDGDVGGRAGNTLIIINESGLYTLILRSERPEAKRFKKWITAEVLPSIRRTGGYSRSRAPAFIRRYNENWDRVDAGYFSVLNELVVHLWGRLEHAGHVMADKAPDGTENRPDVSVGRCFSDWLKKEHPEISHSFSYYMHRTPECEVEVRQYPFAMLPLFREYLDSVWIPERSEAYLRTRDPKALTYLPKLLPSTSKPKAGMTRRVLIRPSRKAS